MARYTVDSFTTAAIAGGATLNIERDISSNFIDLFKIKITPSATGDTSEVFVYSAAARTAADLMYGTNPWDETVFTDPIEDNAGIYTARNEGFVARYEDADADRKLHLSIKNNAAGARTYDVEISYCESPFGANVIGVPQALTAWALANGLEVVSRVTAAVNNATIDEAEFRAKFYADGDVFPTAVDLRTVAEGGTFAHNGTTQLIITGIAANQNGSTYRFTSAASGRWYYAWRLQNAVGWSHWTDGNETPLWVVQFIDTSSNSDAGPPDNWQVTLELGPLPNTVVVRATRPKTNGNVIWSWAVQVKDSSTGSWRLIDANAGAAVTKYDGSGSDHTLDRETGIFGGGGAWGTAAPGDLVIFDVRGDGNFDIDRCNWAIIKSVAANALEVYGITLPLPTATFVDPNYTQIRLKVVKAPWLWNSEGYLGDAVAGGGYWDWSMPGAEPWVPGDTETKQFVSSAIPIPASATTVQARVWFLNGYSASDGNIITSGSILGGDGIIDEGYIWTSFEDRDWWIPVLAQSENMSLTLNTDGTIQLAEVGATRTPVNASGGVVGRFKIYPNSSGVVKVRAKFTVNWVIPTEDALGPLAIMIIDPEGTNPDGVGFATGAEGIGVEGIRNNTGPTHELEFAHFFGWYQDVSQYFQKSATIVVNESPAPSMPSVIELRLTIDEDYTNITGGVVVFKEYEYQIDGGGWNTVTIPSPGPYMYERRVPNCGYKGYNLALMVQLRSIDGGNTVDIEEFEVTNGFLARF